MIPNPITNSEVLRPSFTFIDREVKFAFAIIVLTISEYIYLDGANFLVYVDVIFPNVGFTARW